MVFTPLDPTKSEVRITGEAPNQGLEFYIPRGAKGEPGGIVSGTVLLSTDLNQIKTPGIYRQDNGGLVSPLLNYPSPSSGILYVDDRVTGGNSVMQTYYPFSGASGVNARHFFKRYLVSSTTWGPWEAYVSQRVDTTAGRAIYTWDTVNARDQLVYGDTGWRNVNEWVMDAQASVPATISAGTFQVRRIGQVVHFATDNLPIPTVVAQIFPVAGFRPDKAWTAIPIQHWDNSTVRAIFWNFGKFSAGSAPMSPLANQRWILNTSWPTTDPWPTTLPGTAVGSIPNL